MIDSTTCGGFRLIMKSVQAEALFADALAFFGYSKNSFPSSKVIGLPLAHALAY
jgi:hypothetical protein